ncbi:hypothetical protein LPJ72_000597 [Coemansia sp. Benny D160-2]|nr:hypothetical protein LPJ72_000597 [Coemansia sp. Benny D160-2]
MKLTIAAISALVASVLGALSINNPIAGTVWPYGGESVTVSWISDDGTALTGTVTVQLMEGTDSNNLSPVYTIATGYDASKGSVSFVPPTNLYGSSNYAVRVTSSVSGPHYSHFFEAGNPDITESPSSAITVSRTSASTDSAETSTGSETASTSADDSSSSNDSSSSSSSETSTNDGKEVSDAHSDEDESSEAGSEDESEEPSSEDDVSGLDESSDEPSKDTETHTSGASTLSRPAAVAGFIGAAAFAALF